MIRLPRRYQGAPGAAGPLLYLEHTPHVMLGEWVTLRAPGQPARRGQVIDAGERLTVVQVLEDTVGLAPAATEVELTAEIASVAVGRELLGRTLNGVGRPLDGLPAPVGEARQPVWGAPINPARRLPPADFIETGISAIDGMNTLVRGQKLPVFSGPGLPALELAAQVVEFARAPKGEPFAVVFVAIGITARETRLFLDRFARSGALARSVLYLNEASDPTIERLLAPRVALAGAEFLAFEAGMHVLVVIADMTHYCEALRELATAREEVPGRRGFPGYLYTDLASIYERAGVVEGREGSLTQLPILTVPDDDITHPIADLTGYITEGQIILSRELHRLGIYPPITPLRSLSRLMNDGIGKGRTREDHGGLRDQIYSTYANGVDLRKLVAIIGEEALTDRDRLYLKFSEEFEKQFLNQGHTERGIEETLNLAWKLLSAFPKGELKRVKQDHIDRYYFGELMEETWKERL